MKNKRAKTADSIHGVTPSRESRRLPRQYVYLDSDKLHRECYSSDDDLRFIA